MLPLQGPRVSISSSYRDFDINIPIIYSLIIFVVATSLILSYLSGEQFALPAVLSASLVSLFATGYVPFIKTQLTRSDIDFSLYHRQRKSPKIPDSIRKTDAQRLQALSLCSEA